MKPVGPDRLEAERAPVAPSRNAPCPCGSGKKYKKCCLPDRVTERPAPPPLEAGVRSAADEELTRYLAEFAALVVPRRERDRAVTLFSEARSRSAGTPEDAPADAVGFMDWFINDYRLRTSGRTIVEEILVTRRHSLTRGAGALLASWRDAPVSLYEVVAVEPGTGITLRALLGSGLHRVRDVRGSRALAPWDVVATRLIPIDGAMRIAATVLVFLPEEKDWLLEEVERRFGAGRPARPGGVEQCLKADGLLFHRLAAELAERRRKKAENLEAVTAEGHPVLVAKARYKMTDAAGVLAALRSAEDVVQSEPGPGERAAFVWLRLGASARRATASSDVPKGAIQFFGSFCATADAEPIPTLGDIRVRGSRLHLQCLSRERLGWGKARLAELLGDAARFEDERFESIDTKRGAVHRRSGASDGEAGRDAHGLHPEADDEQCRAIASRHLRDYYRRWIDEPRPVLGGLSPRQAALAPQHEAIEALLRRVENLEEHRRMRGAASCDVSWIRRELGI